MGLLLIALFGFVVPNGFFVYWLFFEFHGLGPVLHDKLALGFIFDVLLALIVLAVYFAKHPIGRVRWYWFVVLSFLGGLGFSLPLYYWLNRRRAVAPVAAAVLLVLAASPSARAQLPSHVYATPPHPTIAIGPHETVTLLSTTVFVPRRDQGSSKRTFTIHYATEIPSTDTAGRRRQAARVVAALGQLAREQGAGRVVAAICDAAACRDGTAAAEQRFNYEFQFSKSGAWRAVARE